MSYLESPIKKVIVFDLDDTLYRELSFVESGLSAVAVHLESHSGVPAKVLYDFMLGELQRRGRGKIFDSLKIQFDISEITVRQMVSVYRNHSPRICLSKEVTSVLEYVGRACIYPLYLVTDGNARVQRSKINALGLGPLFKKTYCTRDFGLGAEKPSVTVFQQIATNEHVALSDIVYIGDDPKKDFHGLIKSGGNAIRIRTGRFREEVLLHDVRLLAEIEEVTQLPSILLEM